MVKRYNDDVIKQEDNYMYIDESVITYEERVILALRALYSAEGYRSYKINKFEEYDLYVRNKDFLVSDGIITFTDTNGKLMALKPDVTLSIVNNNRYEQGKLQKLYYDEKVYRVSNSGNGYRELTQVGLETLGDIDDSTESAVLRMAALSLKTIDEGYVLSVSHTGLITALLNKMELTDEQTSKVMGFIREKAVHEIGYLLNESQKRFLPMLESLIRLPENVGEAIETLKNMEIDPSFSAIAASLEAVLKPLNGLSVRLDCSVPSNMRYYNGIVMNGYVKGIPQAVLSGGRYDPLMKRIGKQGGAIGFAVYLDLLEGKR